MVLRRRAWVEALLEKKPKLEEVLGMPIGKMLGCGHWGCVFESAGDWVVKFSIDPTEGPIWSRIKGIVDDEVWGERGFTKVKSITRITPDIIVGGKKRKVWAIVREAIEPVFKEYTAKEMGERGRGSMMWTSPFTDEMLGYSSPQQAFSLRQGTHAQQDFDQGITGLHRYRELATAWHLGKKSRRGSVEQSRLDHFRMQFGTTERDFLEQKIEHTLNVAFHGPHMGPLGESLQMLATHGLYLQDVHLMNIGWHETTGDDDWTYVVIFDPGHTPTEHADIESALIANGRDAL